MKLLVVVTGPTASGKTSLAISLAEHYGTEIVSADSRQIYKDIPIGTAAPSAEECGRARHHLVGCLPLEAYYSAARFAEDALKILEGIWEAHEVAIVAGGSMMYIDALTRGIDDMPTVGDGTRRYVREMLEQHGLEGVLAQLEIVDPEYYKIVDRANTRRVVHGLEVSLEAGVPYSTMRRGVAQSRDFEVVKLAIDMPRDVLFERINRRVEKMVASGLEKEASAAFAKGDFNSLNTVGYKEFAMMWRGELDRATAISRIGKNTRVYAKKQLTWLKRDTTVQWLDYERAYAEAVGIIEERIRRIQNEGSII